MKRSSLLSIFFLRLAWCSRSSRPLGQLGPYLVLTQNFRLFPYGIQDRVISSGCALHPATASDFSLEALPIQVLTGHMLFDFSDLTRTGISNMANVRCNLVFLLTLVCQSFM